MRLIDADKLKEKFKSNINYSDDIRFSENNVLRIIDNQPTFDVENAIAQYKWERDVAISQLEKLGIGFGQKIDDEVIEKVKEVIRCD